MKLRAFVLFAFLTVTIYNVRAQQKTQRAVQLFDVSGSVGSGIGSGSVSYIYNWQLGKKHKLFIGTGARFTTFFGSNQYYVTAPAKITSGYRGPGVLFKENISANLDSLLLASHSLGALNATINLGYAITTKFTVGLNIDAIGFSFGGQKNAKYVNGTTINNTTAKPTAFNALLISDNDLGTLNSEVFATYHINKRWAFKLGYQFLFTEYTTATNVQQVPEPNDRFRLKSGSFAAGVRFQLH